MSNNELIQLLVKKRSGNITLLEQKRLQELLYEEKEASEIVEVVNHLYALPIYQKIDDSKLWDVIQSKINQSQRQNSSGVVRWFSRSSWLKISAIAAATIVLLSISVYFLTSVSPETKKQNVVATKLGSRSNLILPDGSKVWVNADSKISYNDEFDKGKRELTLIGEAFFDVKHDESRPFIIHTGKVDIKVLGTAFNVRNYPNSSFETSLIRGKIEISLNDKSGKKIVLKPSQKFVIPDSNFAVSSVHNKLKIDNNPDIYNTQIQPLTVIDSALAEISWMNNRLTYVNKPLREIAADLERFYDIKVVFKTAYSMDYRYTGAFENQELDEILKILKLSKSFDYRIKNKELIIE